MSKILSFWLFIALALTRSTSHAEALDFKLVDQDGNGHHVKALDEPGQILMIAVDSKALRDSSQIRILDQILKQNFSGDAPPQLYLIYTGGTDERRFWTKNLSSFKVLIDATEVVTLAHGFHHTFDYVRLKKTDLSVLDKGRLGDANSLKRWPQTARLQKGLASRPLKLTQTRPADFPNAILPALDKACMDCHVRHISGQDLFSNAETVRNWRAMMLKTIRLSLMPGGFDPFSPPMINQVDSKGLRQVVAWLHSGAPLDAKNETIFDKRQVELNQMDAKTLKELGPPDLELEFNEGITIEPNSGTVAKILEFSNRSPKDAFVDKIYLKANSNALHHLKLYASLDPLVRVGNRLKRKNPISETTSANWDGQHADAAAFDISHQLSETSRLTGFIGDYPCYDKTCYRSFIPKNAIFTAEAHYLSTGREEKDKPKILIYFAKPGKNAVRPIKKITLMPSPSNFQLKPHQGPTKLHIEYLIKSRTLLMGYSLHAHLRARSSQISVIRPGRRQAENVFAIPFFTHKYQYLKFLAKPMVLEPGSRVIPEVVYDNSADNDANPDPDANVTMGDDILTQDSHAATLFLNDMEAK